jgi:hypothetical protein
MARTRKPQLVATARNIARSVPDRIVAIAFLDGSSEGGDPELLELGDEELALASAELDGQDPTLPAKSSPSS